MVEDLRAALVAVGHDLGRLSPDALAGVDEFHLGGRPATDALLDSLDLGPDSEVLDVGCGIGGAARTMASSAGCRVTGIDVTPEYIEAAGGLSQMVGLDDRTTFEVASALDLPFDDDWFDAVTMLHVGMNIEDKGALLANLARVLRPGGDLAIYDVMRTGPGTIVYPVPWAADAATSFVASPDDYAAAISAAGLGVTESIDRRAMVLGVIAAVRDDPPPVDLGDLVGPQWPTMFGNLLVALNAGVLAPIQIVAS